MILFNRSVHPHCTSAAFNRFRFHHTEINNLYWSFVPAQIKSFKDLNGYENEYSTVDFFNFKGEDSHRCTPKLQDWANDYNSFSNWTRLNIIMAASSYFEIYYKTIIKLSILSNPGIIFNNKTIMDGTVLLKEHNSNIIELADEKAKSCVIGDWTSRMQSFSKIFNMSIIDIKSTQQSLERIRKIRNSIGHSFGRDIDSYSYVFDDNNKMKHIDEEKVKKYLSVFMNTAKSIDKIMLSEFIGAYEVIYFYHKYISSKEIPKNKTEWGELKTQYHSKTNANILSKSYCKDLIEYYNQI